MSIESNIAELTAAVKELTAALGNLRPDNAQEGACAGKCQTAGSEKPKAEVSGTTGQNVEYQIGDKVFSSKKEMDAYLAAKHKAAKQEPASTQPTAEAQVTAPDAKAENSAAPLDYEKDVKPLFLKLVMAKGRDVAIGLIKSYKADAAKLNDAVSPAQFGEVVAKINELLAA